MLIFGSGDVLKLVLADERKFTRRLRQIYIFQAEIVEIFAEIAEFIYTI